MARGQSKKPTITIAKSLIGEARKQYVRDNPELFQKKGLRKLFKKQEFENLQNETEFMTENQGKIKRVMDTPTTERKNVIVNNVIKQIDKVKDKSHLLIKVSYEIEGGKRIFKSIKYNEKTVKKDVEKMIMKIFYVYDPSIDSLPLKGSMKVHLTDIRNMKKSKQLFNMLKIQRFKSFLISKLTEDEDTTGKHCFVHCLAKRKAYPNGGYDAWYERLKVSYCFRFGDVPANEEQIKYMEQKHDLKVHIFDIFGNLIRKSDRTKEGLKSLGIIYHDNHCYYLKQKLQGHTLGKMIKQGKYENLEKTKRVINGTKNLKTLSKKQILVGYDSIHKHYETVKENKTQTEFIVLVEDYPENCEYYFKVNATRMTVFIGRIQYHLVRCDDEDIENYKEADKLIDITKFYGEVHMGMEYFRTCGDICRLWCDTDIYSDIKKSSCFSWNHPVNSELGAGMTLDFSSAYLNAASYGEIYDFACIEKYSMTIPIEKYVDNIYEKFKPGFYKIRYRETKELLPPLFIRKEGIETVPHTILNEMVALDCYEIYLVHKIELERKTDVFTKLLDISNTMKEKTKNHKYSNRLVKKAFLSVIGNLFRDPAKIKTLTTNNLYEIYQLSKNPNIEVLYLDNEDGTLYQTTDLNDDVFLDELIEGVECVYTLTYKEKNSETDKRIVAPHLSAQLYALHLLKMRRITKELMDLGFKIGWFHTDSITVENPTMFYEFEDRFLEKRMLKIEKKFNCARYICYNNVVFDKPKFRIEEPFVNNFYKQIIDEVEARPASNVEKCGKITMYNYIAGYGKSFLIRKWIGNEDYLITSSTVISAFNIDKSVKSVDKTLGRLYGKWRGPEQMSNYQQILRAKIFVIDEFSMVSNIQFDAYDRRLRYIRNINKPFGGMDCLLFGDCHQLAPVRDEVIEKATVFQLVKEFEKITNEDDHINYRFTSEAYKNFINSLRYNCPIECDIVKCKVKNKLDFNEVLNDKDITVLCSTNKEISVFNSKVLDLLYSEKVRAKIFKKVEANKSDDGLTRYEWVEDNSNEDLPVSTVFKRNCRIMCRYNLDDELFNGVICHFVKKIDDNSFQVELLNGQLRTVKYYVTPDNEFKVFPFMVCYGMTVHKSQGLTLKKVYTQSKAVLRDPVKRYVAFSRVRDFKYFSYYLN